MPLTLWHVFSPSDEAFSVSARPELSVDFIAACLTCPVLYMSTALETPALSYLPDV